MSASDNDLERKPFGWVPAITTFVCLEFLVGLQAFFAYEDRFLTVAQMQGRGVSQGLPFVWHFGMWGDFLMVSPLAAYLVGRYIARWRTFWIGVPLGIGAIAAGVMSYFYTRSEVIEAHVQNHQLTSSGMVHLFYMAIAIAVFVQFLFFTKNVSVRLAGIVSALLLTHVFFGTHMVLGIIEFLRPADWYPAQPLESIPGWATVGAVGIGLGWRNVGLLSEAGGILLAAAFFVFEFFTGKNAKKTGDFLLFLDAVCGLVLGTSYWFKAYVLESQPVPAWMPSYVLPFLASSVPPWIPSFLLLFVATKYLLSRVSVKQELAIGRTLFPPKRIPDDFDLKNRKAVALQVVGFMAIYLVLGWLTNYIILIAALLTVIAFFDFRTRDIINENMRDRLADEKYEPRRDESDYDYDAMLKRRKIAAWYLFALPHLGKELACIYGCAAAFGLALYGYLNAIDLSIAAYATLIGSQILNEVITMWWRFARFLRLRAVGDNPTLKLG
jgi:hypothetical protein